MSRSRSCAFALVLALWPSPARAFRTTEDGSKTDGVAARWPGASVGFYLHAGDALQLDPHAVEAEVVRSWQEWESPGCSGIAIENMGSQSAPAEAADSRNTIQWVVDWQARGFDPSAAGTTEVAYERSGDGDWQIVEADIYLNAENFGWRLGGSENERRDVRSVLVHEIGHALGLLHSCEPGGLEGAPACETHSEVLDTIMHPAYADGRKALSADDEAGICFLYPRDPSAGEGGAPGEPLEGPAGASGGSVSPATLRAPGEPCEQSNQCRHDECLQIDGEPGVCTRSCGADHDCPASWSCDTVEARRVCLPPLALEPSGGVTCALQPALRNDPNLAFVGCLAAIGFLQRTRRRARSAFVRRSAQRIAHEV